MHRIGRYRETDSMSDLISSNYRILLVMSRFGIGLGFGDKSIGEVCTENNVDTKTFLAIVHILLDEENADDYSGSDVSLQALLSYLHNSHTYFLDFRLPSIRKDLIEILTDPESNLSKAIITYFDEYVAEVRNHMMYEEDTVFPYVRALLSNKKSKYNISIFQKKHDQVEARLREFKNILIRYYSAESTNEMNSLLFDIFNCENDLASHNAIEDKLFVPAVIEFESKSKAGS